MSSSDDDVVSVASAPTRRISAAALQKALARTPAPRTSHRTPAPSTSHRTPAPRSQWTPRTPHASSAKTLADGRAAPPGTQRFDFQGPLRRAAAATAPPPAATDDEATAYALGLSYHVEALVRAAEHGGGGGGGGAQHAAAMEVALEQAVASLSACQQQQAAQLQGVVARQKAGFHERLLDLERRFVAEAQALSEELAATVAADKQAAEAAVARHAQTLAGALQRQGGGGAAASLPPPPSAAPPAPARSAGRMPPRIPATPAAQPSRRRDFEAHLARSASRDDAPPTAVIDAVQDWMARPSVGFGMAARGKLGKLGAYSTSARAGREEQDESD